MSGLHVRLRASAPVPLDLELHCGSGELLALVGPSGSGKSTILRCIAGLHQPTHGQVRCDDATWLETGPGAGREIDVPPQRRRVGMVFQSYALFPHMTALENVASALRPGTRAQQTERASALLAEVGLGGLEDRRPTGLSGGQQQRVALARALAREPSVLLLDEPFSAVDRPTRRALQRLLAAMRERLPIPTILVTHDIDEATRLADRMAVLHEGRLLQQGTPRAVAEHPTSLVARLLDLDSAPALSAGLAGRQAQFGLTTDMAGAPAELMSAARR